MVRVTPEVSANASFQNAAAKSARPDSEPSGRNDSFGALVDSNTSASRNDNRPQDPAPAPRRSDDTPGSSGARPGDAADRTDKAPRNDSSTRDSSAGPRGDTTRDDGDIKVDGDDKTTRRGKSKSETAKSDQTDSGETTKPATDASAASADQTDTAQDGTPVTNAGAIAAALAATTAPAPVAPAAPATEAAAAPLAIAAAAIAATASIAADTAPATDAADTATTTTQADGTVKNNGQSAAGQIVTDQTALADPSLTGEAALAASATAANPAATRQAAPLGKTDLARKTETTLVEPVATDPSDTATATAPAADTAAAAATPSPTEAAAKPKSESGVGDAVKPDMSGTSINPPPAHANAHLAAADIGSGANALGNGLPAPGIHSPTNHVAAPAAASQLTATAAAARDGVPVSGLAMEIAASVRSGKTSFEIRLDPAELGRVDVRIEIDRHGQVTSHLTVERPETLSMLRQDANQLQRALDNAGLQTGNSGLQFSLRDQSSQGQHDHNQSNPNAHRLVISEDDSVPAVVAGRGYGRMLGASGGVDIRV